MENSCEEFEALVQTRDSSHRATLKSLVFSLDPYSAKTSAALLSHAYHLKVLELNQPSLR